MPYIKVFVTGKDEYAIMFVNGAIVTNKEKMSGASETCNKDRCESVIVSNIQNENVFITRRGVLPRQYG